ISSHRKWMTSYNATSLPHPEAPENTSKDNCGLYREGNEGRLLNEIRITVVWGTPKGRIKGSSGRHMVFLADEMKPQLLVSLCAHEQDPGDSHMVIISWLSYLIELYTLVLANDFSGFERGSR
ncbi:hypothetical protein COCVIDRAFT_88810, partial [Bipolaris victoriae FI3]